ncbi:uncharacterized protein LOC123675041 [Harmonia axyridis]|uniref:uncharacterized protein LOC123675041 n=1 Tax=Harmonia axyridis TaxID=115357 RepID=UPI001E2756CA|nr:uncharacterized protein LOC123675041 [Harmonia axyridis]
MTTELSYKLYFALIAVVFCIVHIKPVQPLEIKALDQLRGSSRLAGPLEPIIQTFMEKVGLGMNAEQMSSEGPYKGPEKVKPSDSPSTMQPEKKEGQNGMTTEPMNIKPSDVPATDKTMSDDTC